MWQRDCQCRAQFARGSLIQVALFSLGAIIANVAPAGDAPSEIKKRFEVRDSVEMSYFGTLFSSLPLDLDDDGILSPDGRWLVKITHRGVLPQGVTEGTIWLFDASAVMRSIDQARVPLSHPEPLVRISAAVNGIDFVSDRGNTISQLQWLPDSRGLTFLGRDARENRQLFVVDLQTHRVSNLTPPDQDVLSYVITKTGFLYFAAADRQEHQEWWSTGPGIPDIGIGTGTSLIQLLYPHWTGDRCCVPLKLSLWQVRDHNVTPVTRASEASQVSVVTRYGAQVMSLSPDESKLATIEFEHPPQNGSEGDLKYTIIDLKTGANEVLADAPVAPNGDGYSGGRYRAAWSPDGASVAISLLGPANKQSASETHLPVACAVAVATLVSHRMQCAMVPVPNNADGVLYSMAWNPSGTEFRARYRQWNGNFYEDELLEHRHGAWIVRAKHLPPANLPLQLTVREALNDPPVLLATNPKSHQNRVIFDPNPQLANIELGSVSVYAWKDLHGRSIQGGLVKPSGYVPGRRYPLVIQTHGFSSTSFFRVGHGETANAGRALTSRDIIVLQVAEPFEPYYRTWQAAKENGTDVYLAAIDQLTSEGVIDPKKVGITGYSATGLFVANSITRAPERFSAAALSNTDPGSLTDYYSFIDYPDPEYAQHNAQVVVGGAKPYGEGLKLWLERAPEFSTDKITAPILLSLASPQDLMGEWSFYAALRDQGKPVELQYMRSGQHNLSKPLQRFAQQEMLVDWFDFWLNKHEDADPSKANQYARWRRLRELKDARSSAAD
jgi:dienelactone hydrolase